MTDNDIIKALECCSKADEDLYKGLTYKGESLRILIKEALDLLNRYEAELTQYAHDQHELMIEKDKLFDITEKQKAEIERLTTANEKWHSIFADQCKRVIEFAKGINKLTKSQKK